MSVYFAASRGYIKIGYSKDPVSRVSTVTRNGLRPAEIPYAAPADLLGWVPGDQWRETEFHARFAADRVAGEWFRLDPDTVRDLIWADPRGVDMHGMSAMAVFACIRNPDMTRDELEASGYRILAAPIGDVFADSLRPAAPVAKRRKRRAA